MLRRFLTSLVVRSTETVFAVLIVLVFFLGFTAIMSLSFPHGTSLQELVFSPGLGSSRGDASRIAVDIADDGEAAPFVALLSGARRVVKNKRSDAITWSDARVGMALEDRHSVQTFSKSFATIAFGEDRRLDLGENSLVVIRKLEEDPQTTSRRATMIVLDGTLDGHFDGAEASGSEMAVELLTATGSTMVVPEGSSRSDFKVTINPDNTSTFSVYGGTAEVSSAGRTIQLAGDQTVTVAKNQPPPKPRALPARTSSLAPADGEVFAFNQLPPRVSFRWKAARNAEAYRLVIGRDRDLSQVVFDDVVEGTEFVHGNLSDGDYFWRVHGIAGWATGAPGPRQLVRVLRDDLAPELTVGFPEGTIRDDRLVLRGRAESGAEVFVGDSRIPTGLSGEFRIALDLRRGLNLIVVEAVDAAGNIAYSSRLVNAKY